MNLKSRLTALLLCLALACSLLPVSVSADEGMEPTGEDTIQELSLAEPVSLTEETAFSAPASRTATAYYMGGYYVFDALEALSEAEYAEAEFEEDWDLGGGLVAACSTRVCCFLLEGETYVPYYINLSVDETTLSLNRDYLLALPGTEYPVPLTVSESQLPDYIRVRYTASSPEDGEQGAILNPDLLGSGVILPEACGTCRLEVGWMVYNRSGNAESSLSCTRTCRVDVIDPASSAYQVTGVSLAQKSVTLQLFRTDYAKVGLLLEMPYLLGTLSEQLAAAAPEAADCTIVSARFTNETVAALFDLIPTDDRSLAVYPGESTVAAALADKKAVKSSYSSPIAVELLVNGESLSFTTAALTLKISRTLPAVKAKTVSLNSYTGIDSAEVSFPGLTVQSAALTTPVPGWMTADLASGELCYVGDSGVRCSTTLQAELTCAEWRITVPVTVKVTAAPVIPKVTFGKTSVTLVSGASDYVTFNYKVASSCYSNPELYPLELESITESAGGEVFTYANHETISVSIDNTSRQIGVTAYYDRYAAAPHTYTVTCVFAGQSFSFKVTTKLPNVKLTLKASGAIELATGSAVALKPAVSGANKLYGVYPGSFEPVSVTQTLYQKKTLLGSYDITDLFTLSAMDSSGALYLQFDYSKVESIDDIRNLLVIPQDAAAMGCTVKYAVTLRYCYAKENESSSSAYPAMYTDPVTVNFNLKYTETLKPTATLKFSGSLDRLRECSVTLTPTFKNLSNAWAYGDSAYSGYRTDLVFYQKQNGKWVVLENWYDYFGYDIDYAGIASFSGEDIGAEGETYLGGAYKKYYIYARGPEIPEGTFGVQLQLKLEDGSVICESAAPKQLPIKRGSVKVSAGRTTGSLLLKDRYDTTAPITLTVADQSVFGIERVELDGASQKWFRLIELGNGSYAIGWKNNTLPAGTLALKPGAAKTVKLQIYMQGGLSSKPTTTVSVKVSIAG